MRKVLNLVKEKSAEQAERPSQPDDRPSGAGDPMRALRVLYEQDRKPEKGRGGTAIIHASQTIKNPPCARMHVLMYELRKAGATFSETPMGAMRLVWKYGRAAEAHVREQWLSDPDMRKAALGVWECACGKTKHRGHIPEDLTCPHCKTKVNRYQELTLFSRRIGLSGNPDFAFLDGPAYRVVEIKSLKYQTTPASVGFETIESPFQNHVEQGVHYVTLFQENGYLVHREPLILYVNKRFDMRRWYKGFIPEPAALERAENSVLVQRQAVADAKAARESGALPDMLPACVSSPDKHSKTCKTWTECMARKEGL